MTTSCSYARNCENECLDASDMKTCLSTCRAKSSSIHNQNEKICNDMMHIDSFGNGNGTCPACEKGYTECDKDCRTKYPSGTLEGAAFLPMCIIECGVDQFACCKDNCNAKAFGIRGQTESKDRIEEKCREVGAEHCSYAKPCVHLNDNTCVAKEDGICPAGTVNCNTEGRCVHLQEESSSSTTSVYDSSVTGFDALLGAGSTAWNWYSGNWARAGDALGSIGGAIGSLF